MRKTASLIIATILLTSLVSAQWGWGYSYLSPGNLLDNEWVVFGLIFIIFFAVIFFALSKTFKENLGVAAIVAGAIAFIIAVVFSRRVMFYGYFGEEVGGWITLIALLLVLLLGLKAILDLTKSPIILAAGIMGIWALLTFFDWELLLPYNVIDSPFFQTITGQTGFIIALVLFIIIIAASKPIKNAIRKKSGLEQALKSLSSTS